VSVARFSDPESPLLRFIGRTPEDCDFCGKPLADPVVYWHLAGDLFLSFHPACALEFGGSLIYEARRARYIARGQSLLAGIDRAWREIAGGEPR
jgi:hypothetical protein